MNLLSRPSRSKQLRGSESLDKLIVEIKSRLEEDTGAIIPKNRAADELAFRFSSLVKRKRKKIEKFEIF